MFKEAALVLGPAETLPYELALERDSLAHREGVEVLGEPGLALLVDHEHELDHELVWWW